MRSRVSQELRFDLDMDSMYLFISLDCSPFLWVVAPDYYV